MYSGNPYVDRIVATGYYYDEQDWDCDEFIGDETNNLDIYDYCTSLHDKYNCACSEACEHCCYADSDKCGFETRPKDWDDKYFE